MLSVMRRLLCIDAIEIDWINLPLVEPEKAADGESPKLQWNDKSGHVLYFLSQ